MRNMRGMILCTMAALFLGTAALAQPAPFPGILKNARYVYVTSYDGSQWNMNVSPDDRAAIGEVQEALRTWGHYAVSLEPQDADMIIVVQRRGSEDELAVFAPKLGRDSIYLWRVMRHGGLDKGEMPLFDQFKKSVEKLDTGKN